jgi:hypothetical protein
MRRIRAALVLVSIMLGALDTGRAQNIVATTDGAIVEKRALTADEENVFDAPLAPPPKAPRLPERERTKVNAEVTALIDGWPWRPFFHQLGISGSETHFDHPDELFHAMAAAFPFLDAPL